MQNSPEKQLELDAETISLFFGLPAWLAVLARFYHNHDEK